MIFYGNIKKSSSIPTELNFSNEIAVNLILPNRHKVVTYKIRNKTKTKLSYAGDQFELALTT